MYRTQIQLPESLRKEVQRVSRKQEWSVSEVVRRGLEVIVSQYPASKDGRAGIGGLKPLGSRLRVTDPEELKNILRRKNLVLGVAGFLIFDWAKPSCGRG